MIKRIIAIALHPDVCVYSKRNEDSPGIFIWRPCNEVRPHDMWFCTYGKQEASEDEAMEDDRRVQTDPETPQE